MESKKNLFSGLILSISLFMGITTATTVFQCSWKAPNATYDLCPYQLSSKSQLPYFTVWDNDTSPYVRNFSYLFNVAATLVEPPDLNSCNNLTLRTIYGLPMGYCTNITSVNPNCIGYITPITITTGAYQASHGHTQPGCYRLHDGETPSVFSFLDSSDPSQGVALTYLNGDYCTTHSKNRELRLEFVCDPRMNNYPDKEESVSESNCIYTVRMKSSLGCPSECPIKNEQLCNGKGICDFDYSIKRPRCFCYSGLYGDDCSVDQDPDAQTDVKVDDSGYVAGLVVVIILLVLTVGVLIVLFRRLQRLLSSPSAAISDLKGKMKQSVDDESDDGMLDDGVNKL